MVLSKDKYKENTYEKMYLSLFLSKFRHLVKLFLLIHEF